MHDRVCMGGGCPAPRTRRSVRLHGADVLRTGNLPEARSFLTGGRSNIDMKTTISALAVIVGTALLVTGCAQPPTEAVDKARVALEMARSSQAADYATESYRAAEDAVAALDAELQVQSEAFALTRSYEKTAELAAAAARAAEKATEDADAAREATMKEAAALLEEVRLSVAETVEMLAQAPKGKGSQADLEAMKMDIEGIQSGLSDFEAAFAAGRYKEALAKAQAASETLNRIKTDIQTARSTKARATARG